MGVFGVLASACWVRVQCWVRFSVRFTVRFRTKHWTKHRTRKTNAANWTRTEHAERRRSNSTKKS